MRVVVGDAIGEVRLGHQKLPGLYQSMEFDGELELDEKKVPGRDGKSKQPQGFSDTEVRLVVRLVPDDDGSNPLDEVAQIRRMFFGTDRKARPQVYTLVNPIARAMGVGRVLFHKLKVRDNNQDDTIDVTLEFVTYTPIVRKRRRRLAGQIGQDGQGLQALDTSRLDGFDETAKRLQDQLDQRLADVDAALKRKTGEPLLGSLPDPNDPVPLSDTGPVVDQQPWSLPDVLQGSPEYRLPNAPNRPNKTFTSNPTNPSGRSRGEVIDDPFNDTDKPPIATFQ